MLRANLQLLRLSSRVRRFTIAGASLGLIISATWVAQALLVAAVFTNAFNGAPLTSSAAPIVGILAALIVRVGAQWLQEVVGQLASHAVKHQIRSRLYEHLLALGPGYVIRQRTGAVQTTLVEGVEALEAFFARYLPRVVVCAVSTPAILAYLAWLSPPVAGAISIFLLFTLVAPRLWDRLTAEKGDERWREYAELTAEYVDNVQGMQTLKAFGAVDRARDALATKTERLRVATMRHLGVSLFNTTLTNVGSLGGAAAAISVGALEVAAGRLSVPALFVILMLPFAFFRPFSELSYYWHVGVNGLSASKRIGQLLSQTPEVVERAVPPSPSATMTRAPNLSFDRVTFAYSLGERPALRDFSLLVAPGETVAIVGPSGAGKSTAVALLLRFFDPLSGRILLDGRDLRAWPLAEVRRAISVVSQDAYLFHGTIADNIRLARPGATDAEVHAAARAANIHGFVSSLPGGYETLVAERGTTLSGGQRQRVAIARALLKDAPVLVLDEPTSNVDSASEAAIQDSLEGLADGRTTLIIAHRISTVRGADRIVVLSEGRVAESGKHTDLLRHQGDYARLVAAQGRA